MDLETPKVKIGESMLCISENRKPLTPGKKGISGIVDEKLMYLQIGEKNLREKKLLINVALNVAFYFLT